MKSPKSLFSILVIVLFVLLFASCGDSDTKASTNTSSLPSTDTSTTKLIPNVDSLNRTTIHWLDSSYKNIGEIGEDDSVAVVFRFRNSGDKPLVIESVNTSCGCTVPNTLYKPVMPGKTSKITAKFYSKNQPLATHQKQIYVSANTKPHTGTILTFQVVVSDKK